MMRLSLFLALALTCIEAPARSAPVGYALQVTTAYATSDPFPNRLDHAFTEPDTGYFQIVNTGNTTFTGVIGDIAVSVYAGDLSFTSELLVLMPNQAVSVAIPDDASDVGGFNGPAFFQRPGIEIYLQGMVSDALGAQAINLLVADADIHSGVWRTDPRNLMSDSYVLQGGDPWGFDTGDDYELGQANGVFTFSQTIPEPGSMALLALGLAGLGLSTVTGPRVRSRTG